MCVLYPYTDTQSREGGFSGIDSCHLAEWQNLICSSFSLKRGMKLAGSDTNCSDLKDRPHPYCSDTWALKRIMKETSERPRMSMVVPFLGAELTCAPQEEVRSQIPNHLNIHDCCRTSDNWNRVPVSYYAHERVNPLQHT